MKLKVEMLFLSLALISCQGSVDPSTYAVMTVGQIRQPVIVTIIRAAPIVLAGSQSGTGAVLGASSGALIGGAVGGQGHGAVSGVLAGLVIGGIVGVAIEAAATQQPAFDYVVQLASGDLLRIIQIENVGLGPGQTALLQYGPPMHVFPTPQVPPHGSGVPAI